jgi:molybdopterin-containing oxidoreductase family membrane subunit
MDVSIFTSDSYRKKLDSVSADILKNVRINKGFVLWMGFLFTLLALCLYAYSLQLKQGLSVTGLRDFTS